MIKYLTFLSTILISCHSDQTNQNVSNTDDTFSNRNASDTGILINTVKSLKNKAEITGFWLSETKEPLTVQISNDSIFYPEHFESYKYFLKGDSIFIYYPDLIFPGKVFFKNDTLIIESEGGMAKYTPLKDSSQ